MLEQEIFSDRQGQALTAVALALIRCEHENIIVRKSDFGDGVIIQIPGTVWKGDNILKKDYNPYDV